MDEPPSYILSDFLSEDNLPFIVTSVILILLCGLISLMESAFFALKPDQIDLIKRQNEKKSRSFSDLIGNPRLLFTVFTAFKYLMLISCAVIFTIAISLSENSGMVAEAVVLTALFALAGVIIPKILGAFHSYRVAKSTLGLTELMVKISRPVVKPLLKMSHKVERTLEDLSEVRSVEELTQALELAAADKNATKDEKEILKGIVNFGTLTVEDVMRPESEINSVDVSLNFHDLLLYVKKSGVSRLPAYRESFDNIQGVLYIKDLLPYLSETKPFNWQKFLRPAFFVLQSKKIDLLLKDFQEKRVHMALAVDEANRVSGIITLEDIIEEIIGDIHDEFDEAGAYYKKVDDKTFVFDSKISVADFSRILDVDASSLTSGSDYETLGALLLSLHKELPKIGDQIVLDTITLVVEAVDHKRIKKVKAHIHEQNEKD